jgi:hypothetical protein
MLALARRCGLLLGTKVEAVPRVGNWRQIVAFTTLVLTLSTLAQDSIPTFKTGTKSALVWDDDSVNKASSTIRDPLTGNEIHRLSYGGIEVSSSLGYERVSATKSEKILAYTTTVANNTDSDALVKYGGAKVDNRIVVPLWVVPSAKGLNRRDRKEAWELSKMHCVKGGFASGELFFSSRASPQTFTARPKTAITVSFMTKDPRTSSVLCSTNGCHMTGTIRYYITVNRRDYVFVWSGPSIAYCGE